MPLRAPVVAGAVLAALVVAGGLVAALVPRPQPAGPELPVRGPGSPPSR